MSAAGKRSTQGDEYQLRIALHYAIRVLCGELEVLSVDTTGFVDDADLPTIDDIVAEGPDGHREYVQVKKNQPDHKAWTIKDPKLKPELLKAKKQHLDDSTGAIKFYSRSPFGELKKLCEETRLYSSPELFQKDAGDTTKKALAKLQEVTSGSQSAAFSLARRIYFGSELEFDAWDRQNLAELRNVVSNAHEAKRFLERTLQELPSTVGATSFTRPGLQKLLEQAGYFTLPSTGLDDVRHEFRSISAIGRNWRRTLAGNKFSRPELPDVLKLIESQDARILISAGPGAGKTCFLLDVLDALDTSDAFETLFIRGDFFSSTPKPEESDERPSLPTGLVEKVALLAANKRVVVVVDSLDVLAMAREHHHLTALMGALDRLSGLAGVSLVVACRVFDLRYDPRLREYTWDRTVELKPLDFELTVAPLIEKWGLDANSMSAELKSALRIPQNLALLEHATETDDPLPRTTSELYELYLRDTARRCPAGEDSTLGALEIVAEDCIRRRSYVFVSGCTGLDEMSRRFLLSSHVLVEASSQTLTFAHQTICDHLAASARLRRGGSLFDYINESPPYPFVRASVRQFALRLRQHDREVYRKQLFKVISSEAIPGHLKRLLVETHAGQEVGDEDSGLTLRIFRQQPDLFRRLFRAEGQPACWFAHLHKHWVPTLKRPDQKSWFDTFARYSTSWMTEFPGEVATYWLDNVPLEKEREHLGWALQNALLKSPVPASDRLRKLFSLAIGTPPSGHNAGKLVKKAILSGNGDDTLLLRFLTDSSGALRKGIEKDQAHIEPAFVAERLEANDSTFLAVARAIFRTPDEEESYLYTKTYVLHRSSWYRERRRSNWGHERADLLKLWVREFERALLNRATMGRARWEAVHEILSESFTPGRLFFRIRGYVAKPEDHAESGGKLLTNIELLKNSTLAYELGRLANAVYPYLDSETQAEHQAKVLSLVDPTNKWNIRELRNHLSWIPCCYLTPCAAEFLNTHVGTCGWLRPPPEIRSAGGTVPYPITVDQLLELPAAERGRLLTLFGDVQHGDMFAPEGIVGGREQYLSAVRSAVATRPLHFEPLQTEYPLESPASDEWWAVTSGLSSYLRYQAGTLSSGESNWTRPEETLERTEGARALFDRLARVPSPQLKDHDYEVAEAVQAIVEADADAVPRQELALLLAMLTRGSSPDYCTHSANDSDLVALNSTRGIAASTALHLYNRLLEKEEQEEPASRLLLGVIHAFATDQSAAVRSAVIDRLPYTIHRHPEWGWDALTAALSSGSPAGLWEAAERCFYYNYRNNFGRVGPFLNRLMKEAPEAAQVAGRISALAFVAGHIEQPSLVSTAARNSDFAEGCADVFVLNMDKPEVTERCASGLRDILRTPSEATVLKRLGRSVAHDAFIISHVPEDLLNALLHNPVQNGTTEAAVSLIERGSIQDPANALAKLEDLLDSIERAESEQGWVDPRPLCAALTVALREADEIDDPALGTRALDLLDRLSPLAGSRTDSLLEEIGTV